VKLQVSSWTFGSLKQSVASLLRTSSIKHEHGQAIVETALVMPVLLITVTGVMVFGIFLNQILSMTEGMGNSGRVLSVSAGLTTDPCATAASAFQGAAPLLSSSSLTYKLTLDPTAGSTTGEVSSNSTAGTAFSCNSATTTTTGSMAAALVSGGNATLKVSYSNCSLNFYGNKLLPGGCSISQTITEAIQ
jgi:Flp pilus assembly protein TadG